MTLYKIYAASERLKDIMKNMRSIIKITAILAITAVVAGCPPEPAAPIDDGGSGVDRDDGSGIDRGGGSGIDRDGDGLIEISTLEALNNIRYNLEGTSYKTSESDMGDTSGCPTERCSGYELTRSLDFADAASYASGSINSDWRPDNTDPDIGGQRGLDTYWRYTSALRHNIRRQQ